MTKGLKIPKSEIYQKLNYFQKGSHPKNEVKKGQTGEKHPSWKDGTYHHDGRILLYTPEHPSLIGGKRKHVLRSRLVAERCLGRFLLKTEIIHHINEITDDDRSENLYIFAMNGEHTSFHRKLKKLQLTSNL